jgi:type II secretory pathway pseudopilin PulG
MTNQTEKEFKTLLPGLTDKLRTGFVTAIIGILFCAVAYLFIIQRQDAKESAKQQAKQYEQMIEYLKPAKEKLEASTEKINEVVEKANTSLDISDSLNNQSLKKITDKR